MFYSTGSWPYPTNIPLDGKGLPGANTMPYYECLPNTEVKKGFITLEPVDQ